MIKAALGYEAWKKSKSRFGPEFRPWARPEQNIIPALDRADVCATQAAVDEAHARSPTYADFGESVARLFREFGQVQRGMRSVFAAASLCSLLKLTRLDCLVSENRKNNIWTDIMIFRTSGRFEDWRQCGKEGGGGAARR